MFRGWMSRPLPHRINLVPKVKTHPSPIFWHTVLCFSALLLMALLGRDAKGADLTPVAGLEAQRTGEVSQANTLSAGQMATSLSYHHIDAPLTTRIQGGERPEGEQDLESKVAKITASFGLGLASRWQVDVAVKAIQTDYILPTTGPVSPDAEDHAKSEFASASVLSKFKLLNADALTLSVAPFFESASGAGADDSFARSGAAKGGWMIMTSYLAPGILQLSLDGGYRYREREQFDMISVRNEMFYMGAVEVMLGDTVSVFSTGEGRQLKVSDDLVYAETGKRDYQSINTAAVNAGLMIKVAGARISGFGGTSLGDQSLGQGRTNFGLSIAYVTGDKKNLAPASSRLEMADQEASKDSMVLASAPVKKVPQHVGPNAVVDPDGNVVDIGEDIQKIPSGNDDDFSMIQNRLKQEKVSNTPSDDQVIESELEKINKAENAKKAEEERQAKIAEQKRRANGRKQFRDDEIRERELRRDVLENEDIPEITNDEVNWPGLR